MNLLENSPCFAMYAATKEVVKKYQEMLKQLDLTYTQYLVMMVLWEMKTIDMKNLGNLLYLNSNTLTPVINRMAEKGLISKERSSKDKRTLIITLKEKGEEIRELASHMPHQIYEMTSLTQDEMEETLRLAYKISHNLAEKNKK